LGGREYPTPALARLSSSEPGFSAEQIGAGTVLRLVVPGRRVNVLSSRLVAALDDCLVGLYSASPPPAWLMIEGNGRGSFAAGADLSEIGNLDGFSARRLSRLGQRLSLRLQRAPWPTAALVAGHALGGGLDLALSCDLVGATPGATFGHPGLARGFFTGWGGTQRLPGLTRGRLGLSAMLQAETLSARAAGHAGLVAMIAPETQLRDWLVEGLQLLSSWPRPALEAWRVSTRRSANTPLARRLLELARVDTV
jgi:enoyl-CoA hydratase